MKKVEPALGAETEALRAAYAALNRNDIPGFVAIFDENVERIEFEDSPSAGTYNGIEAVTTHVVQGRSTWAEGACEPDRFIASGDKVVVLCNIRVRLKGGTDWIDGRIGDVFTFRDGKAIKFQTFGDERDALRDAGIDSIKA
jgi:uncharacterized protein